MKIREIIQEGQFVDLRNQNLHLSVTKRADVILKNWGPKITALQQRVDLLLPKLIAAAGPKYAAQLQGVKIDVGFEAGYAGAYSQSRKVVLDITVFWDAPDDTLIWATAHELGHIVLGHLAIDQPPTKSRQEEFDADDFATAVAKSMGYNRARVFAFFHSKKEEYEAVVRRTQQSDSTHPSYIDRIQRARDQNFYLSKGGIEQLNSLLQDLVQA